MTILVRVCIGELATVSGSTHPRLISEWSAEIVLPSSMGELDHSGFAFDKQQLEFETLDLKVTNGIMKIRLAVFKRKINFMEETSTRTDVQC